MRQAGMHIYTQKHVKETKGMDRQGWIDALQMEVGSIKGMGVYTVISHSDVRNLEAETGKRVDIIPAKVVWAEKPLEA